MQFYAEVNLRQEEDYRYLVRAFFENFNPESILVINGKQAKMKIVFNEVPESIIKAISYCEIIEMHYSGNIITKTEKNVESEDVIKKEDSAESKIVIKETQNKNKKSNFEIPELKNLAKESNCFENFVELVVQYLELGERQESFKNLMFATTELEKISWSDIKNILKEKDILFTEWDKILCAKRVTEKFGATILPFLKEIVQYKQYFWDLSNPKPKMQCMPEIKDFEDYLSHIVEYQSVEEKVEYILLGMGLNKKTSEQQNRILKIANIAVKEKIIDIETIIKKAEISEEEKAIARIEFSELINNFVNQYEKEKKVKLLDFLYDLQKLVM